MSLVFHCSLSDRPIVEGDDVVIFMGVSSKDRSWPLSQQASFSLITSPLYGKADGFGWITDIDREKLRIAAAILTGFSYAKFEELQTINFFNFSHVRTRLDPIGGADYITTFSNDSTPAPSDPSWPPKLSISEAQSAVEGLEELIPNLEFAIVRKDAWDKLVEAGATPASRNCWFNMINRFPVDSSRLSINAAIFDKLQAHDYSLNKELIDVDRAYVALGKSSLRIRSVADTPVGVVDDQIRESLTQIVCTG